MGLEERASEAVGEVGVVRVIAGPGRVGRVGKTCGQGAEVLTEKEFGGGVKSEARNEVL